MKYVQGYSPEILKNISSKICNDSEVEYFKPSDLDYDGYYWFMFYNEEEIIGILKTQKSMFCTTEHPFQGLNYISVNKKYQNQKIASQLLEACFKHFKDGYIINTDFSDEGARLFQKFRSLAIEYNVYYIDENIKKDIINSSHNDFPTKSDLFNIFYKK